jgi:hypothetical protein
MASENTVKKAKGAKVKIFFQGLHMVYNFKICISSTPSKYIPSKYL